MTGLAFVLASSGGRVPLKSGFLIEVAKHRKILTHSSSFLRFNERRLGSHVYWQRQTVPRVEVFFACDLTSQPALASPSTSRVSTASATPNSKTSPNEILPPDKSPEFADGLQSEEVDLYKCSHWEENRHCGMKLLLKDASDGDVT